MSVEELPALARGRRFIFAGMGSVVQATLPLLAAVMKVKPGQVQVFAPDAVADFPVADFGQFHQIALTRHNHRSLLGEYLRQGDVLINLASDVSSLDLMKLARDQGALYLDTVIEPWAGWYLDATLAPGERTNYALREAALRLHQPGAPTAVLAHGANPGLASHFVKLAVAQLARDRGLPAPDIESRLSLARTAQALGVETIAVAEYDSQHAALQRAHDCFHNTWSAAGFIAEAGQPAELGWGTHEAGLPADGRRFEYGCDASIWLEKSGARVKVQSWVPDIGPFQAYLITHNEAISLSDWLTLRENERVVYRPTSFYAYRPCDAAIASLHDLLGRGWRQNADKLRVLAREVEGGCDTLGVLLSLGEAGCYWYGSRLSAEEARAMNPQSNATTMQVAAGVLGGIAWALKHPSAGVVEPEQMDSAWILEIARPWLGEVFGEYSDWTPLQNQDPLYQRELDRTSPWQFSNLRVSD